MYFDPLEYLRRKSAQSRSPYGPGAVRDHIGHADPASSAEAADQLDLSRYPQWAHGIMAQVFPRLDQAGRLPGPLMLEDDPDELEPTDVKLKHPSCREPFPMPPGCEAEWDEARRDCAGRPRSATGRGFGRSLDECICGQVTARCGGNPHQPTMWDRPFKRKRR